MQSRRVAQPPSYSQSCANQRRFLCHACFSHAVRDPVLILITLAAVVGSFCLLSGLLLLCVVSKTLQDQTSEAILLMGMGFFVLVVACVTWQLTNGRRLSRIIEAMKEEAA